MIVKKPINTHALTLWLLIEKSDEGVTVYDAMEEYHSKFSNRLGELEDLFELKISRLPLTLNHRFGHSVTVTRYKSMLLKKDLLNIYKKVNTEKWESKLKN